MGGIEYNLRVSNAEQKNFIILSSCPWSQMLQRPHQIARALVKQGHRVDFIIPTMTEANVKSDGITVEESVKYSLNNKKIIDGVFIYSPLYVKFNDVFLFNNRLEIIQDLIDNSTDEVVIISYLPSYLEEINKLKGNYKLIYDCVDDHSDLEYSYWSLKKDIDWEQQLMDMSDIILTTSNSLYLSKAVMEKRDNVYLSKNAVNEEDFIWDADGGIPQDLRNVPEPRVCYIGAVDKWFDEELLYKLVRANRGKSFVIIGPVKEGMLSQSEENLYVLGVKEHSNLKDYLRNMNLGIIPFKDDIDLIINCDPIKLYEYISCSLPVVSTNLPELALNKEFIKTSSTFEGFNKAVNELINYKIDKASSEEFIKENTWENRGCQILNILKANNDIYSKENVLKRMREGFLRVLEKEENPIISSLYGLSYLNEDAKKFLDYSQGAYEQLQINFNYKNYLYALIVNDRQDEAIKLIIESCNIDEAYKSEIKYHYNKGNNELSQLLLNMSIKNYAVFKRELENIKDDYKEYYLANYYIETGNEDKADIIFKKLLEEKNHYIELPLFNKIKHLLLEREGKRLNSISYKAREVNLCAAYLNKALPEYAKEFISNSMSDEKKPRFSIIIPTRNSPDTLEFTLKTCLEQEFEDYEIVISDNSSNACTYEMLKKFNSDKIKYYKPNEELPMTYNYNFAISKAKGEYIISLGSDDGLLFHALKILDSILKEAKINVLRWDMVAYGWPEVKVKGYENRFTIPYKIDKNISLYTIENVIEKVINYEATYSIMPMLYCNAVVNRNMVLEIINKTNTIFESLSPDVYSGFIISYLEKNAYSLTLPMSIGGSSHKSNGIACNSLKEKNIEIRNDCFNLYDKKQYKYSDIIPLIKSTNIYVAESFLKARDNLFPGDRKFELDRIKLLQQAISSLYNDDEELSENMKKIYDSLQDKPKLQREFYDKYLNNRDFKGFNRPEISYNTGFNQNGGLSLDASKFGVKDVYGAAELFRNLTGI